jgi:hypothetical protein
MHEHDEAGNLRLGLVLFGIFVLLFGLTFVVGVLYLELL